MKKFTNHNSNIVDNLKLTGQVTLILAAVFGFVFLSYLDLTRKETKPKEVIEVYEPNSVVINGLY